MSFNQSRISFADLSTILRERHIASSPVSEPQNENNFVTDVKTAEQTATTSPAKRSRRYSKHHLERKARQMIIEAAAKDLEVQATQQQADEAKANELNAAAMQYRDVIFSHHQAMLDEVFKAAKQKADDQVTADRRIVDLMQYKTAMAYYHEQHANRVYTHHVMSCINAQRTLGCSEAIVDAYANEALNKYMTTRDMVERMPQYKEEKGAFALRQAYKAVHAPRSNTGISAARFTPSSGDAEQEYFDTHFDGSGLPPNSYDSVIFDHDEEMRRLALQARLAQDRLSQLTPPSSQSSGSSSSSSLNAGEDDTIPPPLTIYQQHFFRPALSPNFSLRSDALTASDHSININPLRRYSRRADYPTPPSSEVSYDEDGSVSVDDSSIDLDVSPFDLYSPTRDGLRVFHFRYHSPPPPQEKSRKKPFWSRK